MPKVAKELAPLVVSRITEPGDHAVGGVAGLTLRVAPSGARSWVLRVRVDGKRPEFGLGGYPTVGVGEARTRARERLNDIFRGIDPAASKAAAQAALLATKTAQETFAQAAEKFIEANASGWRNTKHAAQWTSTMQTYAYPVIGHLSVASITVALVLRILRPIWSVKPETATRVRQRIEKIIAAADAEAERERLNPARIKAIGAVLPARKKAATVEHFASLPYAQMPAFMAQLAQRNGNGARALEWTIYTAARSGMTRAMTWDKIDLERRMWTVPAMEMKATRDWNSPLTPALLALLPPPGKPSELVFKGARKGRPMSDMTLAAVLERMGVAVTPHGFRSTFQTWATEQTSHLESVVELQLAHVAGDAVKQAYQRGELLKKREELLNEWISFLTSAMPAEDR